MNPLIVLFWALVILAVAVYAAALIRGWREWDGPEPVCSLDCRDWQRLGTFDPDCPVHHQTNHFAITESENTK